MTTPPDQPGQRPSPPGERVPDEPPTVAWTPPADAAPERGAAWSPPPPDRAAGWPTPPPTEPPTEPSAAPPAAPDAAPSGPILSASPTPQVAWAPPVRAPREVAPGLVLSDTASRLVAFIVDSLIIGLISGIAAMAFGLRALETSTLPDGTVDLSRVFGGWETTVLTAAIGGIYFVSSWSGGRRATPGQHIFRIQVGNAFDGAPLTLEQAIRRWLGLGEFLSLFAFAPGIGVFAGTVQFFWTIALLLSTIVSPTKQGLHDRFANTAVVRPATAASGAALTCLVIALIVLIILPLLAVALLVALGSQVTDILSAVGESI